MFIKFSFKLYFRKIILINLQFIKFSKISKFNFISINIFVKDIQLSLFINKISN